MKLPSENEFNVYGSLDELTAYKHFGNKTLTEAEELFRTDSLSHAQDFMWMGPLAFDFYLQAVISYLQSHHSTGDTDTINCMYSTVQHRSNEAGFLPVTVERVIPMIDCILTSYAKFEVDKTIYGDLFTSYSKLRAELTRSI
jgi:hypothetical protein